MPSSPMLLAMPGSLKPGLLDTKSARSIAPPLCPRLAPFPRRLCTHTPRSNTQIPAAMTPSLCSSAFITRAVGSPGPSLIRCSASRVRRAWWPGGGCSWGERRHRGSKREYYVPQALIRPRNARSPSPSRAPPPTVRASTYALEAPTEPQQTCAFNRTHAPHLPRDTSGALQRGRSAHPACVPTSKSARESSRCWQPEPKRLRCALALLGMARTRSVAVRPTALGGLLWCCSLRKCGCCSLRKCAGGKTRPREATSCDSARHIQRVQLRVACIARTTALRAVIS
ncbi:hypothetical protein B0H17DRAFT_1340187 [Mycena rosella]|uniref:Uncharacterized protein n=1 Tax=Mycena rosella TaxID=1033263 RepID=A0AAD7BPA8_MYCRO|nr:hypothetical protein B0H17DRAFT_1340187 [Mycena rosella]